MARFREGTGTSIFVSIGSFATFTLLAWVLAVLLWIALSIYAFAEMLTDGRPSPTAVLLIVVFLVGALTTLAVVGVGLVGKSLTPKKRDRT